MPVFAAASAAAVLLAGVLGVPPASAAQPTVGLGTATPFAVLAGTTVTNTGPSVISGDLGVSPGSAVTGFPPGLVINGTQQIGDAQALQAQSDLTTAYTDAAGRTPVTVVSTDLGGQTLAPGVYQAASSMGLTGTVTLDAQSDPNAVFIFQAGSTLITASNSTVNLIGGAQACNVFWQVGSSATLGTDTTFNGNILALTSATLQTGTTVQGRVLARNGQVSLDTNTITAPSCTAPTTTTTTAPSSGTAGSGGTSGSGGSTGSGGASGANATTGPGSGTGIAPGGTLRVAAIVPVGAPQTGAGGASRSDDRFMILVGLLALVGAGLATRQAVRRRPTASAGTGPDGGAPRESGTTSTSG